MSINPISSLSFCQDLKTNVPNLFEFHGKLFQHVFEMACLNSDENTQNKILNLKQLLDRGTEVSISTWQKLRVEYSLDKIKKIYDKTNIIQLRSVPKDCRTLIVGCGNTPLVDEAGCYLGDNNESFDYIKTHQHPNAVTINPDIASNPTIVGLFGAQEFPMIDDRQFDLIVIEATSILDTPIGRKELDRIFNPTGQLACTFGGRKGYAFSWEDNAKNCWETNYTEPPVVIEDLNIYESFNY